METGESSSSMTTYAKSNEFFVGSEEGDDEWYGEGKKGTSVDSVFLEHCMGFAEEEFPLQIPDLYAGESSPSIPREDDEKKEAIFVHSSPSQFPDILEAKRSDFGSIFVKTAVRKERKTGPDLRAQLDSQFSMIPWHMGSMDRDFDWAASKSSVFRAFERRGIASYSTITSQWDVYPITKYALFSFHVQDRVHHTRNIAKIEERLANASVQFLKFKHLWPTGSTWTGHWDGLGMAGTGTYVMPHDVVYLGKMQDGMFHDDDATLVYPDGFKVLHCKFVHGELVDYQFQFADKLDHDKGVWNYCHFPDRRFWSETQQGLKPGKMAQKTQEDPPRRIPDNSYDTNDGFYNPKTKMLTDTEGYLVRVPTCEEECWIVDNCRKSFRELTGFRPDLFENWYDYDEEVINELIKMGEMYESGVITYEQLQEFYAINGILSTCSPFNQRKRSSEVEYQQRSLSTERCGHIIGPYYLKKEFETDWRLITVKPSSAVRKKRLKKCPKKKRSQSGVTVPKIKFTDDVVSATYFSDTAVQPTVPTAAANRIPIPRSSPDVKNEVSGESDTSLIGSKMAVAAARAVIMQIVNDILTEERERHRDRFIRTQKLDNLPFGPRDTKEKSVLVLEDLYRSIPETEEFCDSLRGRASDLKSLAEDKFNTVRYWGNRIFTLKFDEKQ